MRRHSRELDTYIRGEIPIELKRSPAMLGERRDRTPQHSLRWGSQYRCHHRQIR